MKRLMLFLLLVLASSCIYARPTAKDYRAKLRNDCVADCQASMQQCSSGCAVAADQEKCRLDCDAIQKHCLSQCPEFIRSPFE